MIHKGLIPEPKYQKNLKSELGERLDHRYTVKFHHESDGDSLEALERCLDPENFG